MYRDLRAGLVVIAVALSSIVFSACASHESDAIGLPATNAATAANSESSQPFDPDSFPALGASIEPNMFSPMASHLNANETLGFGDDKLLLFRYDQQFDCVVGPFSDLNSIGKTADRAPKQFASPECAIGFDSKLAPSGNTLSDTDSLYILVPFFETNKKTPAFTKALGEALKKLFGFVPDAFKPDPGVAVQCPTPKDKPGTCTMHPLDINLGPLVAQLGLIPKGTNLYVPLVNHDHLLNNSTIAQPREWWKLVIVLIEDPKAWPNAQGTSGITSVAKLKTAQMKKQASADVPSNFFLYFSSYALKGSHDSMGDMRM